MLTDLQIEEAIERLEKGLRQYCWIQSRVLMVDTSTDLEFQRKFNHFYRVRRGTLWQNCFYELMEKGKREPMTFSEALRHLQKTRGSIEASFASKLVATLDPTKPVIDQFVLKRFGYRLPYPYASNRVEKVVKIYEQLSTTYQELLNSDFAKSVSVKFAHTYPWAQITDLKRLDLVLWQSRL